MNLEKELAERQDGVPTKSPELHYWARKRQDVRNLTTEFSLDTPLSEMIDFADGWWRTALLCAINEHEGYFVVSVHGANLLLRLDDINNDLLDFSDTEGLDLCFPISRIVDAKILTSGRFRGAMQLRLR